MLTINGNYAGNNGLLALRTVLGDDLSATDKLVVRGDTSGTTRVSVTNAGGGGSQTVEGIPIVEVEGSSNGTFIKEGRIVAGAYDYNIIKKNNQNWHLTSEAIAEPLPPDEPAPASPETPEQPIPQPGEHQYRPETGSYLANTLAANTLFTTRLHDRLGETQYTDALTGEQKVTSLWMRHIGGHNRFKDSSGQISTQSNRYVMQLGGDIAQWSTDSLDRWHLGLMAGYANSKSRSHSSLTGYTSRGEISGYSAGLYGTWYANDADKTGAYVDGWMLYNWFDNTVSGQGLASEKYDSDGITASVETGYTWKLAEFSERTALYIQPKVQVTWMDVQADTHVEKNGTRVVDKTDGNLQTRLGVKAYLQGHNAMDDGKDRTFQPFVEANWIHNTQNYSVQMDDINNDVKGSRNIGELKAGVEGQLTKNVTLWGNVAQQIGDNGYKDTQGMLGLKYSF
ncbi:autotransporter outer membrane beta-barrel domain-containing protein [Citrobacter amalonaticus]|uniref:Autotransporter outer membrane beta-barrel domain-containing protein n=1 Tax=Citrobacter amalonaticus TaxID=35703 RepID=A0A8I0MPD4_CITAM|nr:autotransporter outer membrane beta-barrel domain-containing protein [Citrobacter amalonaticus]